LKRAFASSCRFPGNFPPGPPRQLCSSALQRRQEIAEQCEEKRELYQSDLRRAWLCERLQPFLCSDPRVSNLLRPITSRRGREAIEKYALELLHIPNEYFLQLRDPQASRSLETSLVVAAEYVAVGSVDETPRGVASCRCTAIDQLFTFQSSLRSTQRRSARGLKRRCERRPNQLRLQMSRVELRRRIGGRHLQCCSRVR